MSDASLALRPPALARGVTEGGSPSQRPRVGWWYRFSRNRGAVAGLLLLCLFAVVAFGAPLATTYDPEQTRLDQKMLEPSPAHLLWPDPLRRSFLARLAYGGRFSLFIGFAAVGVGLAIGVPLGSVCGYFGGLVGLGFP